MLDSMLAVRGTAKDTRDRRYGASVLWGAAVLFVLAALYLLPLVGPFAGSASAVASEALQFDQECCADEGSQDDGGTSELPDFGARAPGRHVTVTHLAAIEWLVASAVSASDAGGGRPSLRTAPKTSPPL
jgi:hypothetical protein